MYQLYWGNKKKTCEKKNYIINWQKNFWVLDKNKIWRQKISVFPWRLKWSKKSNLSFAKAFVGKNFQASQHSRAEGKLRSVFFFFFLIFRWTTTKDYSIRAFLCENYISRSIIDWRGFCRSLSLSRSLSLFLPLTRLQICCCPKHTNKPSTSLFMCISRAERAFNITNKKKQRSPWCEPCCVSIIKKGKISLSCNFVIRQFSEFPINKPKATVDKCSTKCIQN